jgi:3-phosphoshikimate 1-carboxyvinyltransferase
MLKGQPRLPFDKSISHRALMLAALAHGPSALHHLAVGEDVARTRACLQQLGVTIEGPDAAGVTSVLGRGPGGLRAPDGPLDCGNSGTTMRLMMGLLASLGVRATLVGDASLSARPMERVAEPLRAMGAVITLGPNGRAPVHLHGGVPLRGSSHTLTIPSGQLKGALLLAALGAQGQTCLQGALGGRDHTERLLGAFGATPTISPGRIVLPGPQRLSGTTVVVPQDVSAAGFWLAASQLVPEAHVTMAPVGLNPTRTGLLTALLAMGADLDVRRTQAEPEPLGTITARRTRELRAITLVGDQIPPMIDELPLMMVLALRAHGQTVVRDAQELRVKETDRLEAMAENLRRMGARLTLHPDGCTIVGPQPLRAASLDSFGDHRIAMAAGVAAMLGEAPSTLHRSDCVAISDPQFFTTYGALSGTLPRFLEPTP